MTTRNHENELQVVSTVFLGDLYVIASTGRCGVRGAVEAPRGIEKWRRRALQQGAATET